MKNDSRGYALLIVLALLVVVTSVVAGSFSAISRNQRETGREFTRLKTDWAARALYESAVYKFQKFVVNQGHPPNPGTEVNQIIQSAKDLIKADYPNVSFDLQVQHHDTSNAKNVYYSIVAKATDGLTGVSSTTGLKAEEKGYVYTTTGSVLDYGVFNDGDLEISPGEDLEIQGPIFSNGNIYLMSGIGKSLTLSEPDSTLSNPVQFTSDYILHTSGNIFFYFKPVVARNYMLEQSDTYNNGAVSFYKDDDEYHGSEASWSVLREITVNGEKKLVGYPRLYYFKNQILDSDWIVKPAEHNIYFKGRNDSGKGHRMNFPQFAYWAGDTWEYFVGNTSYTNHYYDVNSYPNSENMSISPGFDLNNRIFYNNLTFDSVQNRYGFPEGEDAVTASSAVNPKWPAYRDRLNSDLSTGSAEAPLNEQMSRQVVNLAEDADGNNHALIEPVYDADSRALKNQKLVSKADIVIQCANSNCTQLQLKYRTQEGYKTSGEGDNLIALRSDYAIANSQDHAKRLFYMRPMRNLRLARATTVDSRGAPYYTDANRNPVNRYENAYYQSLVINMTNLNDILEECKKWDDNDDATVSSVITQQDPLCKINVKDGLIIYAETKSFRVLKPGTGNEGRTGNTSAFLSEEGNLSDAEGGDILGIASSTGTWPVRQVILENGERLIRNGVTVATNGWMWTRGHFNVWEYPSETQEVGSATRCVFPDIDSTAWKNCKTPAAALFSDSFGIIASTGSELDAFESYYRTPTVSRAPQDQSVMINATVLTGYLSSTLERSFPDCKGLAAPDQLRNCGGSGWPGTDYIGAPCPAGIDSNGNPIEKKNCNFYLKKQTGVFYFRRNAILRDWLSILWHEISEYEAIRAHFKYTLSDGTVLDALRFPDQPNWFSGTANNLTIPQLLTELQSDIAAMEDHMTQYVDFDPNDPASYQILEGLRAKYGRAEFHLPTFEGYFVDPPNVGAARGALYGPLGYNSEGVKKNPNVGDVYAFRYAADKTKAPAYMYLGHPVYFPGVAGSSGDMGGYYSTPNYGSAWIIFDPLLADITNEDTKKQQKYRNQVKLMWCGSTLPADLPADVRADWTTILATCTDVEKTNQIYWRIFSYDFNQFPHHWTGIPFYAGTSYGLGLGQKAGDPNSKAVLGMTVEPVPYSPVAAINPKSNLQTIGVPQINGIGYQSVRIEMFYQANMIGTSSGSGKWVVHPGVNETDPPTQEYIPDPNATARFYNLRDARRSWGVVGFLRPYHYDSANPNAPWNTIYFAHGRQYPIYDVRYSGGWENLMNFQEQWAWNSSCHNDPNLGVVCDRYVNQLYFRGSQAAPWKSQEMLRMMDENGRVYDVADSSKPAEERRPPRAFWRTDYYSAPQRYYDYDERLSFGLMHRPPGMINLVSVSRAKRLPKDA